jgi:serine/threonine-protein kinase
MTTAARAARIRAEFDRLADAPAVERPALLDELRAADADLAAAVGALLDAADEDFLSSPPALVARQLGHTIPIVPGARIGPYQVLGLIGEGGMGEVFEARLGGADFEKRVAIKVLRAGLATPALTERFARERRILARLEHRNIAALHDGGVTSDGRPYLVMDLVAGRPITQWCRERALDIASRLTLFGQVSGAVQHAHRLLVVHRDLKPGNILVTDDGTVKLLDFGIAKVLAGDGGDAEPRTLGDGALTPQYAAPEQLTGEPITTATDVYALGLLLVELLTGARPRQLEGRSVADMVHEVTMAELPRASTLVRDDLGIDPLRARAALRGDLDAIIARALAPRPEDRYASAGELQADLDRHRHGLPVEAMRGRTGYRLRKALRRHRTAFAALAAVVGALAIGAVATLRQAARAEREQRRAEETNAFLTGMLRAANPLGGDRDITVAAVLDRAARAVDRDPPTDAAIEASLREAIGSTYASLGRYEAAEPHLRRALALRAESPGAALPHARALHSLASWHDGQGQYLVADSLYAEALVVLAGADDPGAAAEHADLLHNRARMQSQLGRVAQADSLIREAIALQESLHGRESAEVGVTLSAHGLLQLQHGEVAQAESTLRTSLALQRVAYGRDRPETAHTLSRLATALELQGRREAADTAYRAALAMFAEVLGDDHPEVTWTQYNFAGFLLDGGDWQGALAAADVVLGRRGITVPESQAPVSGALQIRGLALAALGDRAGAEAALRESLALRVRHAPAGHWTIGSAESVLGEKLVGWGARAEGLALLEHGANVVTVALGPDHPQAVRAAERLRRVRPP